jgi:hypothetical protein
MISDSIKYCFIALLLITATPMMKLQTAQAQSIDTVSYAASDSSSLIHTISNWATSNWIRPGTTKLERVGYVIGASLIFSLFDYIAFHKVVFASTNTDHSVPFSYRIAQAGVQTLLSYALYEQVGLSSTVAFNTIWWTWGDDIAFYGWLNLINASAPWYNRSFHGLQGNGVTWAGWTPIGITRKQGTVIDKYALFAQAGIGFSIAMIIN